MTPKEKAQEIFNKMYQVDDIMGNYPMCFDTAKQCARIAVDEIITFGNHVGIREPMMYWNKVKTEILKYESNPKI